MRQSAARGTKSRVRHVCVVTGTRAEYGLLRPVMQALRRRFKLSVVAAGMHLCHEFGNTVAQLEADRMPIADRIDMTFGTDRSAGMAKSIGIGVYGMAQTFERLAPDVVLVLGDRVEAFAGAISAAALNRVVAHIHGGEITKGGLDESMRHAISKLAHVHFVATESSGRRVRAMGERAEHVHVVGAPGLDVILRQRPLSRIGLERKLGFAVPAPVALVVQHPVSSEPERAARQMQETIEGLRRASVSAVIVYPNSDAGGRRVIDEIERARRQAPAEITVVSNLEHRCFLALLRLCDVLVGNSSSGMIEAGAYRKPVVNVGSRQEGRERGPNVLDVDHDRVAIASAIRKALDDPAFRRRLRNCRSPYGDGRASERIVRVLGDLRLGPALIQKQLAI